MYLLLGVRRTWVSPSRRTDKNYKKYTSKLKHEENRNFI